VRYPYQEPSMANYVPHLVSQRDWMGAFVSIRRYRSAFSSRKHLFLWVVQGGGLQTGTLSLLDKLEGTFSLFYPPRSTPVASLDEYHVWDQWQSQNNVLVFIVSCCQYSLSHRRLRAIGRISITGCTHDSCQNYGIPFTTDFPDSNGLVTASLVVVSVQQQSDCIPPA